LENKVLDIFDARCNHEACVRILVSCAVGIIWYSELWK